MKAWRGAAFGLELKGDFPAPGLSAEAEPGLGRLTTIELAPRGALALPEGVQLFEQALPGGSFAIDRGDDGFGLQHSYYGAYRVSGDGSEIVCSPNDLPDWEWQRFLVGQALPLAAALHGLEPLHASAVALGGRAVIVMGTSGSGKTSVALHMAARSGAFLTDDVASLELGDGIVLAHGGPRVASLDPDELARIPGGARDGWKLLGEGDGEVRVELGAAEMGPLPVAAVFIVTRRDEGELQIAVPRVGLPEVLLGGTFNAYLRDPDRLVRQLEVSSRLAETAQVREVTVPPGRGADDVAEAIIAAVDRAH